MFQFGCKKAFLYCIGTFIVFANTYAENPPSPYADKESTQTRHSTGKEEIALDESDYQGKKALRRGNWDNRANWRYNREAYFRGETQAEVNLKQYPYGRPGIGYDGDPQYMEMERQYRQMINKEQNQQRNHTIQKTYYQTPPLQHNANR